MGFIAYRLINRLLERSTRRFRVKNVKNLEL